MLNIQKIKTILLILFFLFVSVIDAYTREKLIYGLPYIDDYFDKNDDIKSASVYDLVEIPDGGILAASSKGILMFDGQQWNLVLNGEYESIAYDSLTNKIYIGTSSDFGYIDFDRQSGQYVYKKISSQTSTIIKNTWKILSNRNGVYFFVNNKSVFRYYNGKLQLVDLKGFRAQRCQKLGDDAIWIVDDSLGIGILSQKGFSILTTSHKDIFRKIIIAIYPTGQPYIYRIFTRDGSEFMYNIEGDEFNFVRQYDFLKGREVKQVKEYVRNKLIFLTERSGIYITSNNEKKLLHLDNRNGLETNSLSKIYIDKFNIIWITSSRFVARVYYSVPYRYITNIFGFSGEIYDILLFKNKLVLATSTGLYLSDSQKNIFVPLMRNCSFDNTTLLKISKNGKEYIIAAPKRKILIIDGKFRITKYNDAHRIISFSSNSKGLIYALTIDSLVVYKLQPGPHLKRLNSYYLPYLYDMQMLINDSTLIFYSKSNKILRKVILQKDRPDLKIVTVKQNLGTIYSMIRYNDSIAIMSSDSGLYQYNFLKNEFSCSRFKALNNKYLKTEKARYLLLDSNLLWILTDRNLLTYNFSTNKFKGFPIQNKASLQAYKLLKWHFLIIGSSRFDIFLICPRYIQKFTNLYNSKFFPVYLSFNGVKYYFLPVDSLVSTNDNKLWYLNKALRDKGAISLRLGFEAPYISRFLYSYKLDNGAWSKWSENGNIILANLPAGKRSLTVRAKAEDTDKIYYLTIVLDIRAPFYRTWWMKIIYLILAILLIIYSILEITKKERRRRMRMERLVRRRTKELEEKNRLLEIKNQELKELADLLEQQKEELEAQNERLSLANLELRQLSLVAQKTSNSVLILDKRGRLEWWNEGFTKLFKHKYDVDKTQNFRALIKLIRPDVYQRIKKFPNSTQSLEYTTHEIIPEKNQELWYKTTITPVYDENGEIYRFVVLDIDITEIKLAEKKIKMQKEELELQTKILKKINQEIEQNRRQLEIHHREMLSSLEYAKKIQAALLPYDKLHMLFPKHFILDRPKEIVSGDFYYIDVKGENIIVSVADGTGHGVPGAFMSILGLTLLKDAIEKNAEKISSAAILDTLRASIIKALHQGLTGFNIKDGLDIALGIINLENHTLNFSGANIPIHIVRDKEILIEIRPDRMPIGIHEFADIPFNEEFLQLKDKDRIYIFTDGYVDQFGGPDNKRYKRTRFKRLLLNIQDLSMSEQKNKIERELDLWMGENDQIDDITVLGFEVNFGYLHLVYKKFLD